MAADRAGWGTCGVPASRPRVNHFAGGVANSRRGGSPNPTVLRTPAERAKKPSQYREAVFYVRRPSGSVPNPTGRRTLLYRLTRKCGPNGRGNGSSNDAPLTLGRRSSPRWGRSRRNRRSESSGATGLAMPRRLLLAAAEFSDSTRLTHGIGRQPRPAVQAESAESLRAHRHRFPGKRRVLLQLVALFARPRELPAAAVPTMSRAR